MNLIKKLFFKNEQNPQSEIARETCGSRVNILCIILNTILAGAKIALGVISGAVSILADGFNNLTDCGSNVVSIIGIKVSGKPADKEHPFGHQRAESVCALLISALILVVAFELAVESINKIISPEPSVLTLYLIIILAVAILVKVFMAVLNFYLGKLTGSQTLKATALDSLSDSIATTAVLISFTISYFTDFYLDGYVGILVSLFIAFSGFKIMKETVSGLLGLAPDKEVVKDIVDRVMTFPGVHGFHDLAVHNYGPSKMYATIHIEVNSSMPIMHAHELADDIERHFIENTNIILTVHIDPLVLDDPIINELRDMTNAKIATLNPNFKTHDFRVVGGKTQKNIVFDIAVPFDTEDSDEKIEQNVKLLLSDENTGVVVTVERQNIV